MILSYKLGLIPIFANFFTTISDFLGALDKRIIGMFFFSNFYKVFKTSG